MSADVLAGCSYAARSCQRPPGSAATSSAGAAGSGGREKGDDMEEGAGGAVAGVAGQVAGQVVAGGAEEGGGEEGLGGGLSVSGELVAVGNRYSGLQISAASASFFAEYGRDLCYMLMRAEEAFIPDEMCASHVAWSPPAGFAHDRRCVVDWLVGILAEDGMNPRDPLSSCQSLATAN